MAVAAPLVMGAQLLGGAVGAVGAMKEAGAQRQAALYQAGVARNQAQFEEFRGMKEAERKLAETGQLIGQQRVAAAANGVDVNTGSIYDIQTSTRMMGEVDAQTLRENARNRANSQISQARLYEMEAKNARSKGFLDAFGSILGSASSVGSTFLDFKNMGAIGGLSSGARSAASGGGWMV